MCGSGSSVVCGCAHQHSVQNARRETLLTWSTIGLLLTYVEIERHRAASSSEAKPPLSVLSARALVDEGTVRDYPEGVATAVTAMVADVAASAMAASAIASASSRRTLKLPGPGQPAAAVAEQAL